MEWINHHLISDIHYQKGFDCIKCHNNKNRKNSWERINCVDCHISISPKNHPKYHQKIACIACHSAWQVNSYGTSLYYNNHIDYSKFKRFAINEDRYVQSQIIKAKQGKATTPAWILGYKFRRWESFYMVNYQNSIELSRPISIHSIIYIIDNNITQLNGLGGFSIAKPHTIIKEAKSCESCHNNRLNLNDKSLVNYDTLKGNLLEGSTPFKPKKTRIQIGLKPPYRGTRPKFRRPKKG